MENVRHPLPPVGGRSHPLPWMELNPSMMTADLLQSGGQISAFCQSHDHQKEECALAPPSSGNDRRPRPYRLTEEVCRRFNRPAGCTTSRCRFDHKCWSCGASNHGASSCRSLKPEVSKPRPPPGPAPARTSLESTRAIVACVLLIRSLVTILSLLQVMIEFIDNH